MVPARYLLGLRAIIRFALAEKDLATGSGTNENKREEYAQARALVDRVVTEVSGGIRQSRGPEMLARRA